MRYLLQAMAMLGDIILIFMAAVLLAVSDFHIFSFALIYCAFRVWWKSGEWEAWRPSVIRQFMRRW